MYCFRGLPRLRLPSTYPSTTVSVTHALCQVLVDYYFQLLLSIQHILQKLRYVIPAYVLNILYHSLVLSHLQYCTLFWANSYHSHLHKLRLLQKKDIRIISNTDNIAHSSKLFLNLKLLKLDDIMTFQLGTFMYKLKYNKLPNVIPHMFVTNENIHSNNTRNKTDYPNTKCENKLQEIYSGLCRSNPVEFISSDIATTSF